jgi:hypothetical protein
MAKQQKFMLYGRRREGESPSTRFPPRNGNDSRSSKNKKAAWVKTSHGAREVVDSASKQLRNDVNHDRTSEATTKQQVNQRVLGGCDHQRSYHESVHNRSFQLGGTVAASTASGE